MKNFYIYIKSLWANRIKPIKALKALRALAANKEDTVQVFHVIDALGGTNRKAFRVFKKSDVGKRILENKVHLIDTLKRKEYLSKLPEGSLGKSYYNFIYKEKLTPDELVSASEINFDPNKSEEENIFHTRLRDMHDLWHVTTGYGRDALGELSLLAFTYAQEKNRGIGAIVLYGYRIMGKVTRELNFKIDLREVVREGYKLGKEASFWAIADWENLLEKPITEVRAILKAGKPKLYNEVLHEFSIKEENHLRKTTKAAA
jgi:ubiquinone biosynthesis protein COQ4